MAPSIMHLVGNWHQDFEMELRNIPKHKHPKEFEMRLELRFFAWYLSYQTLEGLSQIPNSKNNVHLCLCCNVALANCSYAHRHTSVPHGVVRSTMSVLVVLRLFNVTVRGRTGALHNISRWVLCPLRVCDGLLNASCT